MTKQHNVMFKNYSTFHNKENDLLISTSLIKSAFDNSVPKILCNEFVIWNTKDLFTQM